MTTRDLLFELRTEELPPRTLLTLSTALAEGFAKSLAAAGIVHGAITPFATPRRLAVLIARCAEAAPEKHVERRGPPVVSAFDAAGNPTQAASAFAKSCGVAVGDLPRLSTDKGQWLAYRATEPGITTVAALPGIVAAAIAALPIAKRMRWGAHTAEFARPVRSVVLLFGDEVVPVEVLGLVAGRTTTGHRFHAPKPITLKTPRSYAAALRRAKVVADFAERRDTVRAGVVAAAATVGGEALIDAALLDEVTALVEWPVPIAGRFEARFLDLPREVVIATVQDHQRYFPVQGPDGRLTGGFVTVANLESRDPQAVRQGNERVVRPRLSDAAFFWDQDCTATLDTLAERLSTVTFQTQLGSYADKTLRVRQLAETIARRISARSHAERVVADAGRAAVLGKADLMSAMVGEFPELQGTMGRHYALAAGESPAVALAIEEHYRPRFAGDALPTDAVGQALALADKLDTLVGIFAIDLRPTGTKDPFGLRRAALGILRILLEGGLPLDLTLLIDAAAAGQPVQRSGVAAEVYDFIAERLRGLFLERADGTTVEMIDAVLATRPSSPLDAEARLGALRQFLERPEAAVLTAINKRIANILRKAPPRAGLVLDASALLEPAEMSLQATLGETTDIVTSALSERRYGDALDALTRVRAAVDEFFEKLMVMHENPVIRGNRLALLGQVQALLGGVADLSRLPG